MDFMGMHSTAGLLAQAQPGSVKEWFNRFFGLYRNAWENGLDFVPELVIAFVILIGLVIAGVYCLARLTERPATQTGYQNADIAGFVAFGVLLLSFGGIAFRIWTKYYQAGNPLDPWAIVICGLVVMFIGNIAFCYGTRTGVIARATTKEGLRQPMYFLLRFGVIVFILLNVIVPFFALGEDLKMYKDVCLITMLASAMFLSVWTASTSISEEIEGKTAMTLLSKPINRRSFIVGKYAGIMNLVLFLLIPCIILFLLALYYKVGYDSKESGLQLTRGELDFLAQAETLLVLPSLLLVFMEVAIMAALSVAISTRLPMIVNIVTCFAIFVIGHLTPVLVKSVFKDLEFVRFIAQFISTILPSLEIFSTQSITASGTLVPPDYIGIAAIYTVTYSASAISLAFIFFEDRDLA